MLIELDALSVRHPAARAGAPDAIRALGLSVQRGEQVAVIGPSGAGKTSLLHALACALKQNNTDTNTLPHRRRGINGAGSEGARRLAGPALSRS